jgi:hypothetical protein
MATPNYVHEKHESLIKKIENVRREAVDIFNHMVGNFNYSKSSPTAETASELWAIRLVAMIASENPFYMAMRKQKEECMQEVAAFESDTLNNTSLKDGLATIYLKEYFKLVEISRQINRREAGKVRRVEDNSMQHAFRKALGY